MIGLPAGHDSPANQDDRLPGLIAQLQQALGLTPARDRLNRAVADARSLAGPAASPETVMAQAGHLTGLRFRRLQGTWRQLADMAHECETGPLLARTADGGFLIVSGSHRQRLFRILRDGREQIVSGRQLQRLIGNDSNGTWHWYQVRPLVSAEAGADAATAARKPTPWQRLVKLLKPEARDIRSVLVFSIVVGILSLTTPLAVEAVVNTIAFGRYLQPLVVLSLMVFVFLVFRAGLGTLLTIVVEIMQRRLFVRVVDDLAIRLSHVAGNRFRQVNGAELVNRFFDVVTVQKIVSKLLLSSLLLVLQTLIGMTVLAFYHPFLLGYDIGLLLMMTVILFFIGRGAVRTATAESATKYRTAAWLQEIARNPNTFGYNGGSVFAADRADELAAEYVRQRKKHFRIVIRQVAFSMLMQAVAATLLLAIGGYLVIVGQMTLGQLVAAELIVTVILGSFAKLGRDLESFYDLLASVEKLGKMFDLEVDRTDLLNLPTAGDGFRIELRQVAGNNGQSVSQIIPPGQRLVMTGATVHGASEMIEFLTGQRRPPAGEVLVNGFRLDGINPASLKSQVALIGDVEVIAGSIEDNLRLGRPGIDSAQMHAVLERFGLEDVLSGLPDGILTPLGVSGFPLTPGETVRLLLARALLNRPAMLVIDRALDRLTDHEIDEVLLQLGGLNRETTLVIASGRRAIVEWADDVIEFDDRVEQAV